MDRQAMTAELFADYVTRTAQKLGYEHYINDNLTSSLEVHELDTSFAVKFSQNDILGIDGEKIGTEVVITPEEDGPHYHPIRIKLYNDGVDNTQTNQSLVEFAEQLKEAALAGLDKDTDHPDKNAVTTRINQHYVYMMSFLEGIKNKPSAHKEAAKHFNLYAAALAQEVYSDEDHKDLSIKKKLKLLEKAKNYILAKKREAKVSIYKDDNNFVVSSDIPRDDITYGSTDVNRLAVRNHLQTRQQVYDSEFKNMVVEHKASRNSAPPPHGLISGKKPGRKYSADDLKLYNDATMLTIKNYILRDLVEKQAVPGSESVNINLNMISLVSALVEQSDTHSRPAYAVVNAVRYALTRLEKQQPLTVTTSDDRKVRVNLTTSFLTTGVNPGRAIIPTLQNEINSTGAARIFSKALMQLDILHGINVRQKDELDKKESVVKDKEQELKNAVENMQKMEDISVDHKLATVLSPALKKELHSRDNNRAKYERLIELASEYRFKKNKGQEPTEVEIDANEAYFGIQETLAVDRETINILTKNLSEANTELLKAQYEAIEQTAKDILETPVDEEYSEGEPIMTLRASLEFAMHVAKTNINNGPMGAREYPYMLSAAMQLLLKNIQEAKGEDEAPEFVDKFCKSGKDRTYGDIITVTQLEKFLYKNKRYPNLDSKKDTDELFKGVQKQFMLGSGKDVCKDNTLIDAVQLSGKQSIFSIYDQDSKFAKSFGEKVNRSKKLSGLYKESFSVPKLSSKQKVKIVAAFVIFFPIAIAMLLKNKQKVDAFKDGVEKFKAGDYDKEIKIKTKRKNKKTKNNKRKVKNTELTETLLELAQTNYSGKLESLFENENTHKPHDSSLFEIDPDDDLDEVNDTSSLSLREKTNGLLTSFDSNVAQDAKDKTTSQPEEKTSKRGRPKTDK